MVEERQDWAVAVIATALVCIGILVVLMVRSRRRVRRIRVNRKEWTPERFWELVGEPSFPREYRDSLLRHLQARVASDFPVMPTDSLSFFDIGTYLPAMRDEFVSDFCVAVGIHPPTKDEISRLPPDQVQTVKDLIHALTSVISMRTDRLQG